MLVWFIRHPMGALSEFVSNLIQHRYRIFLFGIRSASIVGLILQCQILISLAKSGTLLYRRRRILREEYQTIRILFGSTVRQDEHRQKFQKTLKRLKKMCVENPQQRRRTI